MDITSLKPGESGLIERVECEAELKERLRSLNFRPGAEAALLRVSFFKKTYLVQAGGSLVALRGEVAACVKLRAK